MAAFLNECLDTPFQFLLISHGIPPRIRKPSLVQLTQLRPARITLSEVPTARRFKGMSNRSSLFWHTKLQNPHVDLP